MKSRLREQYVAFVKQFDDAMVKGDAAAAAALFRRTRVSWIQLQDRFMDGRLSRNSLQTDSRKYISSAMSVRPISIPLIL
jgi:hypothetical protein